MDEPGYWEKRQKMIDEKYATGEWSSGAAAIPQEERTSLSPSMQGHRGTV
ncbi:hypothetical protein LJC28_02090 [Dysgonomonas sp. OttesenSCG-928-D17]|nr:hypothetical protein [Dysgonomonas sp. OttesenSCG-928-D17]